MKIDNKLILEHSKKLNLLYVEDDEALRDITRRIFLNYFNQVDVAVDGKDALEAFRRFKNENDTYYDLIISDINMPNINGIDMSRIIVNENPDQSIIFITAHNDTSFLQDAIKVGVDGFLTKPLDPVQLKILLYKTTQSISDHKLVSTFYKQVEDLNMKLHEQNEEINKEKLKLEEQVRLLKIQVNTTNTKHHQVEQLLKQQTLKNEESTLSEYFTKDEDDGDEKVIFLNDDCDEMSEILNELPELLMQFGETKDIDLIHTMAHELSKVSSILLRYTPFLDPLAKSFSELSSAIDDNIDLFINILDKNLDSTMMIYDAVSVDMELYIQRFSVESMAMKNIHHIHHPTTLSIQQIISFITPEEVDEGEIDFF